MYKLFRDIHLFLALISLPFVMVYAISAVEMLHPELFRWSHGDTKTERTITVPADRKAPREVAAYLMDQGVRGDLKSVEASTTAVSLFITLPGTFHSATYAPGDTNVRVETRVEGWVSVFNRLHQAGGFWHDHWTVNVWGWLVLLSSLALIAIGLTGVVLWYLRKEDRNLGWGLLVISFACGVGLVTIVRFAG